MTQRVGSITGDDSPQDTPKGQRSSRVRSSQQSLIGSEADPSEQEEGLVRAVRFGILTEVMQNLEELGGNPNTTDFLGRSLLEVAIDSDHYDVAAYLLPKINIAQLEDALKCAVAKDSVRLCELVLSHPKYKKNRHLLMGEQSFYQRRDSAVAKTVYTPDLTPLVLAAQRNNYQIVQLLLQKGARVKTPHAYFCSCTECTNQREFDSVKYSRTRLNTYRAICSPSYMSLSAEDPLVFAFKLSLELDELATIEKEYKNEYQALSATCRDYAYSLFDLCRTTEEVMSILNGDDGGVAGSYDPADNCLKTLKLAVKCEQKRFIAHSACQRQLILLWYSGVPWLRHQKSLLTLLLLPFSMAMLPFLSVIYLLIPRRSKLGSIMRTPFTKFVNAAGSNVTFLTLILLDSLFDGNKWVDVACGRRSFSQLSLSLIIMLYVAAYLWYEITEIWSAGLFDYLSFWWNWMDFLMLFLYLGAFTLRILIYARISQSAEISYAYCIQPNTYSCKEMDCMIRRNEDDNSTCPYLKPLPPGTEIDPNRISDVFYATATMISFARISFLMPANEQLGPLLVSFGRMVQDVYRVLVIMILIFFTFLSGMTSLYQGYRCQNHHFSSLLESARNLFWASFNMGDTAAPIIDRRHYTHGFISNQLTDETNIVLTELCGYFLFGVYIMMNAIVLINMLIAMLSNTFQEVYDDKDVEWKFARAKLWMVYFEEENILPPPFNLLPSPYGIVQTIRRASRKILDASLQSNASLINENKRTTQMLVKRYIHKNHFTEHKDDDVVEGDISTIRTTTDNLGETVEKMSRDITQLRSAFSQSVEHIMEELADMAEAVKTKPAGTGAAARRRKFLSRLKSSRFSQSTGDLMSLVEDKQREAAEQAEQAGTSASSGSKLPSATSGKQTRPTRLPVTPTTENERSGSTDNGGSTTTDILEDSLEAGPSEDSNYNVWEDATRVDGGDATDGGGQDARPDSENQGGTVDQVVSGLIGSVVTQFIGKQALRQRGSFGSLPPRSEDGSSSSTPSGTRDFGSRTALIERQTKEKGAGPPPPAHGRDNTGFQ